MAKYKVTLNFERDVLGSQPADSGLRLKYIAEKMETGRTGMSAEIAIAKLNEEIDDMKKDEKLMERIENMDTKGITVFYRDKSGNPAISDIQLRGFVRAAFAFQADQHKLIKKKSGGTYGTDWYRKWICERIRFITQYAPIPIKPEVIEIEKSPGGSVVELKDRPLRAMTMQGPRVSISSSEVARAPFSVDFEFETTDDVPMDWLVKTFDRGKWKGIGQWHNAQWGSFSYDLVQLP